MSDYRVKWNGIETSKSFIYWFDWIENPANRMVGYENYPGSHKALCFWWFCVVWGAV